MTRVVAWWSVYDPLTMFIDVIKDGVLVDRHIKFYLGKVGYK